MFLRELYIQEDNWTSHKDLANIIYKHTGNRQLAVDFFNLETEFDSQDDMQSTGLTALDMDPFAGDRERVNRILSLNNVPVKVLKMKHNDAYQTLYSLLQSAPVSEAPKGSPYGQEGKPEWYDRAVALKKANPDISFVDISKEVGGLKAKASPDTIAYWLTGGASRSRQRLKRSNFPFKPSDFPKRWRQISFDEAKPEWYDRAVKLKTDNPRMTAKEISRQIGLKKAYLVRYWLTGNKGAGMIKRNRPHTKDWPPFKPEDFPKGVIKYPDGAKPKWYNKAVQLKKNNPDMPLRQIAMQLGISHPQVSRWLIGLKIMDKRRGDFLPYNPNPPFSKGDFYKAPKWLPDAEKLKTDNPNMSAAAIGKKLGVDFQAIMNWLTGEQPAGRGKVGTNVPGYKPKFSRADFARTANDRIKAILNQVNTMLANNLSDQQITSKIADQYGKQFASDIKSRLPVLRQKQNPGTQVIDKSTGTDITGMRIGDLPAGS